jgi:hypothetical protein
LLESPTSDTKEVDGVCSEADGRSRMGRWFLRTARWDILKAVISILYVRIHVYYFLIFSALLSLSSPLNATSHPHLNHLNPPSFKPPTSSSYLLLSSPVPKRKETMTTPTPTPLRIGVLLLPAVQLLDLSPIDLFAMLTKDYLCACNLPTPLVSLGIPVTISYISSLPLPSPPSTTPSPPLTPLTASARLALTTSISSPTTAPGTLDIILIPGPDPSLEIPASVGEWLVAHHAAGCTLMGVCTGIFVMAGSGLLDGKEATGPRGLMGELRAKWPMIQWVERRWVRGDEGRVWSSGMSFFLVLFSLSLRALLLRCDGEMAMAMVELQ